MKKIVFVALLTVVVVSMLFATAAFAAPASCNGAIHGAFNYRNSVYGVQSSPSGVSDSYNSSAFGLAGGSGGGQTGINNSGASAYCNGN